LRQERPQKEMVRDGLEYALRKFEKALGESSELLHQLVAAFETEQQRVSAVRRRVVLDIEGKGEAIRLDEACLHNQPVRRAQLGQAEHWKSTTMKHSWEQSANELLQEVSRTLQNAGKLREKAMGLREQKAATEAECLEQACEALHIKAEATTALKATAEFELSKIQEELDLASNEHYRLQQAIMDKSNPLGTAQQRLQTRNLRPQREKIRDRAEQALEQEVQLLTQSMEELSRALQAVSKNLQRLDETRKTLAADVDSKARALEVDTQCLAYIQESRGGQRHCAR